ncbi:MAG: hypothetical protein KGJ86_00500 [Chloroflexota bacterium]|nr:hypothetical protein [Chloroflexota bacterium]
MTTESYTMPRAGARPMGAVPAPVRTQPEEDAWGRLVALEPRLQDLYQEARAYRRPQDTPWCGLAFWYGDGPYRGHGLKARMCALVGFGAPKSAPPELRTSAAYDVAYQKLLDALPDCPAGGECWCW